MPYIALFVLEYIIYQKLLLVKYASLHVLFVRKNKNSHLETSDVEKPNTVKNAGLNIYSNQKWSSLNVLAVVRTSGEENGKQRDLSTTTAVIPVAAKESLLNALSVEKKKQYIHPKPRDLNATFVI